VANVFGIQWWAALVASYLAPSRASKIAACCNLEALHTKVSLITANPVGSLARDPPDIDIWGYAGQDPLFTAPKDLRNLAAAVIPARYALSTVNYCIMHNCCYCPLGIACLALSTVPVLMDFFGGQDFPWFCFKLL
jgi:hypothetical protein